MVITSSTRTTGRPASRVHPPWLAVARCLTRMSVARLPRAVMRQSRRASSAD
uniref:Uncharacterized protein n=1 Tax=uncultured alpha proteobacterium HF0070_17D04 TaxID=710805 RepID=E0XS81_9PROT|nr:hypothetical protein [uncultured alpha proteobacterium HF0070_17D04]